jgi:hypothetical protein
MFSRIGFARINPAASFGQPYVGNPNLLIAYPFPKAASLLSVHILLHLALALTGMFVLMRQQGASPWAAILSALTFTLSGYVLSATASLNSITTIAWLPWVHAAAIAEPRRRARPVPFLLATAAVAIQSLAGEPVLFALTLASSLALVMAEKGWRDALRFAAAAAVAIVVTSPLHLATVRAAADSARVTFGFTAAHALSASLHPMRLLEIPFPLLFGDPSKLLAGAWWGYAFSSGMLPYAGSVAIGILPVLLILAAPYVPSSVNDRFWWALFAISLLLACSGSIPGAAAIYTHLPPLHVVRFPIKFYLLSTFAIAVLAGRAFDRLAQAGDHARSRAVRALASIAIVATLAALVVSQHLSDIARLIVAHVWDPAWRGSSQIVLGPVLNALPVRLIVIAALAVCMLLWVGRPRRSRGHVLLLMVAGAELAALVPPLLPTVPAATFSHPSPLVVAAQQLRGRVYEQTDKDLTAVVFGLRGRYRADDIRELAEVQARQAWALSGVQFGIRYAFDQTPDGSYTARNQVVEDIVRRSAWPRRLKWLRAAGVAGVISASVPPDMRGLTAIYREPSTVTGIPTTLYAIDHRLPEVRRVSHTISCASPRAALELFDATAFDPATSIVLEGPLKLATPPDNGSAQIRIDAPDRVGLETSGDFRAVVFLARSYTSSVFATVNGRAANVYPANVHLIAVPVPPGRAIVSIRWR